MDVVSAPILTPLDWGAVFLVISLSIAIGVFVRKRASDGGVTSYFVAGRDIPWWLLGTSMVATSFASDTPLVITGWIAKYGIAGNWFWWGSAIATVAMAVVFSRRWRASGVITDAELCELRYGGVAATLLRTFKATLNATIVNSVVLGWVLAGMVKIAEPFMDWEQLLGTQIYSVLADAVPDFLLFQSLDNSLTILTLMAVTLLYSAMGGLRAVILTDLFQFSVAMVMSIVLSILVVKHLGGLESMWAQLAHLYPEPAESTAQVGFLSAQQVMSFVPSFDAGMVGNLGIPFSAFLMTLGVLWWTNGNVDGSGMTAQRLCTAKNEEEAEKGALWFGFAHFVVRSWPWIIVGVAALVIYPRADVQRVAETFNQCEADVAFCTAEIQRCRESRYQCQIKEYSLLYRSENDSVASGESQPGVKEIYREDRERAYPAILKDILPVGLKGLALASLMAAFMSTVSTLINWGASYAVNDVYLRFINRGASNSQMVMAGRLATCLITVLSLWVASSIDNIGAMWELYLGLMAGLGLPHLLRWLWWRANAWTEIAGMATGFTLALSNYAAGQIMGFPEGQMSVLPSSMASHPIHVITWIAMTSCAASILMTLATEPVPEEQLRHFVAKVRPFGFWHGFVEASDQEVSLFYLLRRWILGCVAIYSGLMGIGFLLRLQIEAGISLLLLMLVAGWMVLRKKKPTGASLDMWHSAR